jgi:hypothetical protein
MGLTEFKMCSNVAIIAWKAGKKSSATTEKGVTTLCHHQRENNIRVVLYTSFKAYYARRAKPLGGLVQGFNAASFGSHSIAVLRKKGIRRTTTQTLGHL